MRRQYKSNTHLETVVLRIGACQLGLQQVVKVIRECAYVLHELRVP